MQRLDQTVIPVEHILTYPMDEDRSSSSDENVDDLHSDLRRRCRGRKRVKGVGFYGVESIESSQASPLLHIGRVLTALTECVH